MQSIWKNNRKKNKLIFAFDNNDINKALSLDELIKSKFIFEKSQCPNYWYTIDGISKNENNLLNIV